MERRMPRGGQRDNDFSGQAIARRAEERTSLDL